ncbi:MAG: hypothetical protein SFW35_13840 [Chitinophagales bacterium]|nr:hypothetical protein [Chitinophagales bacterium]
MSTTILHTKKQLHELIDAVEDADLLALYLQLLLKYTDRNTFSAKSLDEIMAIPNGSVTYDEMKAWLDAPEGEEIEAEKALSMLKEKLAAYQRKNATGY